MDTRDLLRVHFVSAHYGGKAPWKHEVKSDKYQISCSYYDDNNSPSRHLSMHPRLKAKIPKMLEWRFIEADWYVWMDSSIKLTHNDPAELILKTAGSNPLCLFRHSYGSSIEFEAKRVLGDLKVNQQYVAKRYQGEPIREQLIHYLGDPDFVDERLFGMTFFAYHRSAAPLMQEWFLHNLMWSIEDQISFPYVLYKSGLTYSLFDGYIDYENELFHWDWKTRENNLKSNLNL